MEGGREERFERESCGSGAREDARKREREGSADFSKDENLPLPHGLFSSLDFFFLLTSPSLSFHFHPIPCGSSRNGCVCVCACGCMSTCTGVCVLVYISRTEL